MSVESGEAHCLEGKYEYTRTNTLLTWECFYCEPKGNVNGPGLYVSLKAAEIDPHMPLDLRRLQRPS